MFPAVRVADAPNAAGLQKRYDYDGANNLIFEGWANQGVLSNQAGWAIKKYTYTGSNLTQEQYPALAGPEFVSVWDNRAALQYA